MILEIPIKPFPAVRVNGKGWRFMPRALQYHDKVKELRGHLLPHRREIIQKMILGTYHIQFHFAMAKSWSNKLKIEMEWKAHDQTPDLDNLFKAFTDTIFYGDIENDSHIWNISCSKHWGKEDMIVFVGD